jgi:hypothetical protein
LFVAAEDAAMPRFRFIAISLGIVGSCIVALVHAQDRSSYPSKAAPAAFAADPAQRPIGDVNPYAAPDRSNFTSNRRRGSLADRIQAARRGASAPSANSQPRNSPATPPATGSLSDETSPMPTLADPLPSEDFPTDPLTTDPATSYPATLDPTIGAPDLGSPALLAPDLAPPENATEEMFETAESIDQSEGGPSARSAGLPSVLKKSPGAWRGANEPAVNESLDASEPLDALEENNETRIDDQAIEGEASPSDGGLPSELGSGRADPRSPPTARRSRSSASTVASTSEYPALRVKTIGPAAVRLGKEAIWKVEIENAGATAAREVAVSVHLPKTVEVIASETASGEAEESRGGALAWNLLELAAGAKAQLQIRAIPRSAGSFELRADWTCRPVSVTTQVEVQEPKLQVAIAGPTEVTFGASQIYTVVFSNPGTGDAENVQVTLSPLTAGERDPKPSSIGTIPAGAKKQVQLELVARQAGTMEIKLRASADGGLEAEGSRQVKVKRAQLQVVVQGPKLHYAGAPANYRIAVSNVGDDVAHDVILSANLPPGAKPTGKSSALTWQVGELAPGVEREFEFDCEFATGGECTIAALAEAGGNLTAAGEMSTQVEALADLKLSVNDPRGAQPVGEDAVYEITVVNRGARAAQQVEVFAQFSDGIEPTAAAGAAAEIVTGQVIFKPIAEIGAGETISLKVTARAEASGNHIFRAEVRCADPETKLVSESTTRYFGNEAP